MFAIYSRSYFRDSIFFTVKHYGAGIPILPDINRFVTPHGFYGIFISQRAKVGDGCTIYQQVTIGSNDLPNSGGHRQLATTA